MEKGIDIMGLLEELIEMTNAMPEPLPDYKFIEIDGQLYKVDMAKFRYDSFKITPYMDLDTFDSVSYRIQDFGQAFQYAEKAQTAFLRISMTDGVLNVQPRARWKFRHNRRRIRRIRQQRKVANKLRNARLLCKNK